MLLDCSWGKFRPLGEMVNHSKNVNVISGGFRMRTCNVDPLSLPVSARHGGGGEVSGGVHTGRNVSCRVERRWPTLARKIVVAAGVYPFGGQDVRHLNLCANHSLFLREANAALLSAHDFGQ